MPNESTTSTTKIALVTGGSRGIGRSTVVSLAKRGVNSIFTYNSNPEQKPKKVVGLVAKAGQKAIALQLDTGKVAYIRRLRPKCAGRAQESLEMTHFDYLVNNAGNNHRNMPFREGDRGGTGQHLQRPFQRRFLSDAEAPPPDQRWRADHQHIDGEDSHLPRPEGRSTPR